MAAKTLLNAVNETLKRVNEIAGDAGALTSLTDSARQHTIDVTIQVINEGVDKLYEEANMPRPNNQAQGSITLATGVRSGITLASDLVKLHWPLIDRANSQLIRRWPNDYNDLFILDIEQDDTGLPHWAAISPVDGTLTLDRAPTSADNGKVYYYQYEKDLAMSAATDTVPFVDEVFRAMVPVWAQLWKREKRNEFDTELYKDNLGRAARLLGRESMRTDYNPRC